MALLHLGGKRCFAFRLTTAILTACIVVPTNVSASDCRPLITAPKSQFLNNPTLPPLSDYAIQEGEIITCDDSNPYLLEPYYRGFTIGSIERRWPYGIIPYTISSDLNESSVLFIQRAIASWNKTSVTLIPLSTDTNTSHISFIKGAGCASWLGHQGGKQEVIVNAACTTGNILHEIGHAIGLRHEHTRADRDNHISIVYDNIMAEKKVFFDAVEDEPITTEYDYASIMHYGAHQFSANGRPTIIAPDGVGIGQRNQLSKGDLESVDSLYGTDLTLLSSYAESNDERAVLAIHIHNIGDMGAHLITVTIPLAANPVLTALQGEPWACTKTSADYLCTLPLLGPDQGTELSIQIDQSSRALVEQMLSVQSKTKDTDLSNNGDLSGRENDYSFARLSSDHSSSLTALQTLAVSLEKQSGISTNNQSAAGHPVTQLGAASLSMLLSLLLILYRKTLRQNSVNRLTPWPIFILRRL